MYAREPFGWMTKINHEVRERSRSRDAHLFVRRMADVETWIMFQWHSAAGCDGLFWMERFKIDIHRNGWNGGKMTFLVNICLIDCLLFAVMPRGNARFCEFHGTDSFGWWKTACTFRRKPIFDWHATRVARTKYELLVNHVAHNCNIDWCTTDKSHCLTQIHGR